MSAGARYRVNNGGGHRSHASRGISSDTQTHRVKIRHALRRKLIYIMYRSHRELEFTCERRVIGDAINTPL